MPFEELEADLTPASAETKPDVFSLEGLIAWLETQEPDHRYVYINSRDCLLCRYFRSHGVPVESLSIMGILMHDGRCVEYPEDMATASRGEWGWNTYGEALSRARKLLASQPKGKE